MNPRRWLALLALAMGSAAACDRGGPPDGTLDSSAPAPARPGIATGTATASASEASASSPSSPTASAARDSASASGSSSATAAEERSPAPTLAEWSAVKEVTVKGSSALGCETKLVREWLRVSCKDLNDTGGAPLFIFVTKGDLARSSIAMGEGTMSLVVPYVEGIDDAYRFSWSDRDYTLTLRWPKGAPRPNVLGVFEGALSPLDGKRIPPRSACKGVPYNEDCERTYRGDCKTIELCAHGHYAQKPNCLEHFRLGPQNICFRMCTVDGDCPVGEQCHDDFGPPSKVCFRLITPESAPHEDRP